MSQITAVYEFGERGRRFALPYTGEFAIESADDILHFEEVERPGNGAMTLWIVAHHRDGSTTEFNGCLVGRIERAAPEGDDDGE